MKYIIIYIIILRNFHWKWISLKMKHHTFEIIILSAFISSALIKKNRKKKDEKNHRFPLDIPSRIVCNFDRLFLRFIPFHDFESSCRVQMNFHVLKIRMIVLFLTYHYRGLKVNKKSFHQCMEHCTWRFIDNTKACQYNEADC